MVYVQLQINNDDNDEEAMEANIVNNEFFYDYNKKLHAYANGQ